MTPMLFLFYLSLAFCRWIEVRPNEAFEFDNRVEKGALFKLIYSFKGIGEVYVYDVENNLITHEKSRGGSLFTQATDDGRIKIIVKNKDSSSPLTFSYKCPDPAEELPGNLGFVEKEDIVSNLTNLLDKLIEDQKIQIERTKEHYKLVEKSRIWARVLMFLEIAFTAISVYLLHKDFISMFEKKASL